MNLRADDKLKRLVIGCGTGRCGTVSLVKFLNAHAGISVLHEGVVGDRSTHHLVPWSGGEERLWTWLAELESGCDDAAWYGDVGFYFLPYLPAIFGRYPTARVICLERGREEVVKSYLAKTEGRNHWYGHDGAGWEKDPEWDDCFPHYAEPDKRKALGLYWDHYHCTAMEYSARFSGQFMLLPTSSLNDASGRNEILKFIGYGGADVFEESYHANATYKDRLTRVVERVSSLFAGNRQ